MREEDVGQQFEKLWSASVRRAEGTRVWSQMTLREMTIVSSQLRRALEQYGRESPDGTRMDGGAFDSPKSSGQAGSSHGRRRGERPEPPVA